jgi:mannitol/fructose-specific phosphotransferase system IIA component (Ntr-type)
MTWWKNFKPSACNHKLPAAEKEQALRLILETMTKAKVLQSDLTEKAAAAMIAREELATTGVGNGMAIPHIKLPGLTSVACSIVVLREPIDWAAVDGAPVDIVITILRPDASTDEFDPAQHIKMMQWVAGLARDGDFCSFVRNADKKSTLVDLLKEHAHA